MARADHVQLGRRFDRLDIHAHLTTTDQPGLLREIVVELVVHELRPSIEDGFARLAEGIVLVAATADGSHQTAITKHEHLGPNALRRRASRRNDGDERRGLTALERFGDGGEDLLVHLQRLYGAGGGGGAGRAGRAGRAGGRVDSPAPPAFPAHPALPATFRTDAPDTVPWAQSRPRTPRKLSWGSGRRSASRSPCRCWQR